MSNSSTNRRRFLSFITNLLMGIIGLLVAVPALGYFWAPLRRNRKTAGAGQDFQDLGPLSDFPQGEWSLRTLEKVHEDGWKKTRVRHALWVRRPVEGDPGVAVLSSLCPHLGCPINWHPDQTQFVCPCHGGIFDDTGRLIGGPPPRSMDAFDCEVRAGRLYVRWQDFKIGVAERVPVNT